jgi:hypothetical protein
MFLIIIYILSTKQLNQLVMNQLKSMIQKFNQI